MTEERAIQIAQIYSPGLRRRAMQNEAVKEGVKLSAIESAVAIAALKLNSRRSNVITPVKGDKK